MLSSPDIFPADYTIDLTPISDVYSIFSNFVQTNTFISEKCRYMFEILYNMKRINKEIYVCNTTNRKIEDFKFDTEPDIKEPEKKIEEYLFSVQSWYDGLRQKYFPDDMFCSFWFENKYSLQLIETKHPFNYEEYEYNFRSDVKVTYRIMIDNKSKLPNDYSLILSVGPAFKELDYPYLSLIKIESTFFSIKIKHKSNVAEDKTETFGLSFIVEKDGIYENSFIKDCIIENKQEIFDYYNKMHNWTKEEDLEIIKYCDNNKLLSSIHFQFGNEKEYPLLSKHSQLEVDFRCRMLDKFSLLWKILHIFINFNIKYENSLSKQMKSSLYLLTRLAKFSFIEDILKFDCSELKPIPVLFDSLTANQEENIIFDNPANNHSMFTQAYLQLKDQPIELYKSPHFFMTVMYKGEEGIDAGGLFRDSITQIVSSIFNPNVKLMLPCGNTLTYLPYPKWKSPSLLNMYRFIGILMGVSLRYDLSLPFSFPPLVWKKIMNEEVTIDDLKFIDPVIVNYINTIKECTEDIFSTIIDSSTKCVVGNFIGDYEEFIEGGSNIPLTYENKDEMVELIFKFRINEFDKQIDAIRAGLFSIISPEIIYLLTVSELEYFICGDQEIDIDTLKNNTVYDGYNENEDVIKNFWIVMKELSKEQKSKWIYFVWGVTRVPCTKNWSNKFKIYKAGNISELPKSHTCFFRVDLPPYPDYETMKKNILLAIEYGSVGILNQ